MMVKTDAGTYCIPTTPESAKLGVFCIKNAQNSSVKTSSVFEGNKTTNALSMNPVTKPVPTSQDILQIPPDHLEISSVSSESK